MYLKKHLGFYSSMCQKKHILVAVVLRKSQLIDNECGELVDNYYEYWIYGLLTVFSF